MEIGVWSIYGAVALGLLLVVFFTILAILYYSVVMVSLGGTVVVGYVGYMYYGPNWEDHVGTFKALEDKTNAMQNDLKDDVETGKVGGP